MSVVVDLFSVVAIGAGVFFFSPERWGCCASRMR